MRRDAARRDLPSPPSRAHQLVAMIRADLPTLLLGLVPSCLFVAGALAIGQREAAWLFGPGFLYLLYLDVDTLDGRRSALRRLGGHDERHAFKKACEYGKAPAWTIDSELWLDVLDEVVDGRTHRRRLRVMVALCAVLVAASVGLATAAALSEKVTLTWVTFPLFHAVMIGVVIGTDRFFRPMFFKPDDLRRDLESRR